MWCQGRHSLRWALPMAAICWLSAWDQAARGQIDLAHPPQSGPIGSLRDLAPAALPADDPAPAELGATSTGGIVAGDADAAPYRNDATINDLAFVDAHNGWAVGDAGVIWHTADGGQHWQWQQSGFDGRLQSVQFIDAKIGWAAGGRTAPYTHLTSGVLLRTRDGGEHWTAVDKLLLPALRRIQFTSPARGYAIGQSNAMYPCGIFFTDDGGRQWSPLPIADAVECSAAYLSDVGRGDLALAGGQMAVVRGGRIMGAKNPPIGLACVRQLQFSSRAAGWLVGDGGLALTTADGGRSWHSPAWQLSPVGGGPSAGETAAEIRRQFDFSALAVGGPNVWIAGSPGNRVFHSPDEGRTWTLGEMPQNVPIATIAFVDELHGWCAGALGTIEATDDGGRTWHTQRAGAQRVALLGIFSEPGDVPLELFARASAADGYLSAVELINRRDVETHCAASASLSDRVQESLASLGVARAHFAWQFPLRQPGIELPAPATTTVWDQAVGGDGLAELDAYLVRQIRTWRPSAVVTSEPESDGEAGSHAAAQLLQQAIVQAVRHAADPAFEKSFAPWRVQRLFAALPAGKIGAVSVNSSQLSPRLGRSLAELTWLPRGLILDRYTIGPDSIGFRPLENPLDVNAGGGDFFSGLGLRPGGEARREMPQPTLEAVSALRRAAQQRRNAQAILKRTAAAAASGWLEQLNELTAAMDSASAGEMLFQLGHNYARVGQWDSATRVFELLANQYPQHPLTPPAQLWLLQSYASSIAEHEWHSETTDSAGHGAAPENAAANAVSSFSAKRGNSANLGQPADNRFTSEAAAQTGADRSLQQTGGAQALGMRPDKFVAPGGRPQRAIELAGQIERTCPALFAEPAARLPMAAAYRRLGMLRESERTLIGLRGGPHDAWWACAEAENWLAQPRGPAPKSVWHCAIVNSRPRLDGSLDDPMWQRAEAVELHSPLGDDAAWPATAKLACDRQFLYLAVRCRQVPGADYRPAQSPRPRQADLSAHDRIDLVISPDRDYTSYYRLSIDHRGWVNSGCWNDAPWQPACFVATGTRGGCWIVEAALPWDQLVNRSFSGRGALSRTEPWAVNIQRTIPASGFQSWSNPAGVLIRPEGMGLLMFEPPAAVPGQASGARGAK